MVLWMPLARNPFKNVVLKDLENCRENCGEGVHFQKCLRYFYRPTAGKFSLN